MSDKEILSIEVPVEYIGPTFHDVITLVYSSRGKEKSVTIGRACRDIYGAILIELYALPVNGKLVIKDLK